MILDLDDVLTGLERVSDHCSNIAVEMITILDDDFDTHEYFESLSGEDRKNFNKEYEELIKQYPISKKEIEQSKNAQ